MEFHRAPLLNEVLWALMLSLCHPLKYESGWKYRRFQEEPRRTGGEYFLWRQICHSTDWPDQCRRRTVLRDKSRGTNFWSKIDLRSS